MTPGLTTDQMRATWDRRHETAGPSWAPRYWASVDAPHREALESAWAGLPTPRLILEVGANAGPNLRRAAHRWSEAQLWALDANAEALAVLAREAQADGWGHRLVTLRGDLRTVLPALRGAMADLVFSVYTLAYIAPDDLPMALWQCGRVARSRVILVEPMTAGASVWLSDVSPPGWAHDYLATLRGLSTLERRLTCAPLSGPDGLDGIVTWEVSV